MRPLLPCAAILALLAGCATTVPASDVVAQTQLLFANGQPAGTVLLEESGESFTLAVSVRGVRPGAHGFHLHTTGRCDRPDFTSAGGHLNPLGRNHGPFNPQGGHLGDLLNLEVGADGTAIRNYDLPGERTALLDYLFDADGTAIIIHEGADDYRTDPAGDAGSRIACGVLQRT